MPNPEIEVPIGCRAVVEEHVSKVTSSLGINARCDSAMIRQTTVELGAQCGDRLAVLSVTIDDPNIGASNYYLPKARESLSKRVAGMCIGCPNKAPSRWDLDTTE